jgi:hypothetical protein
LRPASTPLWLIRLSLRVAETGLSVAASAVRVARELLEEPDEEPPEPEPARREGANGRPPAPVPEPEHVDEGLVVVAEVAEEGAEEGAGAEVHADEPWDGYRAMTAADIRARLADADAAVAAAVKLYEGMHKDRTSVIEAADRRLRG